MTAIDREISLAHLEAAGWTLDKFVGSNPFECHIFYVRDYRTGHFQVFALTLATFEKLEPLFSVDDLAGTVAYGMKKLAKKGRLPKNDLNALGAAIAGYFKLTVTYRMWKGQVGPNARLHGVIVLYEGGHVRPFISNTTSTILSAPDFMQVTDTAMQMDRIRHPEWFAVTKQP